ncbi:MAG: hypothetical protein WC333_01725 [Dehalococcoidia bacterium]|jgi:hypothetical protein
MYTVICPKCKKSFTVSGDTEYVLCCDEVIFIPSNGPEMKGITFQCIQEGLMRDGRNVDRIFLGDPNESIAPDPYEGL